MSEKVLYLDKEEIFQGNLILVNRDFPLRRREREEAQSLAPIHDEYPKILMDARAAVKMKDLLREISGENSIVPVSGYRSAREQTQIYEDSEKENGEEFTKKYVALPYCSEHQTGLAMDLGLKKDDIDFICPEFPYEGICQTFREKAAEFGFTQRYLEGKEEITGISPEPWHFRYVGEPHAGIMRENHMVLEEYVSFLRDFRRENPYVFQDDKDGGRADGGSIEIFFVPAEPGAYTELRLAPYRACEISGNNSDGFFVTVWREQE